MWLRVISSCSCLTDLTGPARVLLNKTYKPLFPPLYIANGEECHSYLGKPGVCVCSIYPPLSSPSSMSECNSLHCTICCPTSHPRQSLKDAMTPIAMQGIMVGGSIAVGWITSSSAVGEFHPYLTTMLISLDTQHL